MWGIQRMGMLDLENVNYQELKDSPYRCQAQLCSNNYT